MKFADTCTGVPKMPVPLDRNMFVARSSTLIPEWRKMGLWLPKSP